jgi:ZIP family zinc transporter
MVEPLAGVLGALAEWPPGPFSPTRLAFAAGAMIFDVVEDAIPEAQREGNNDVATMGAMVGFA